MPPEHRGGVPTFRFDRVNERLWCEAYPVRVRRKTLAVLRVLMQQPGQVVTSQALYTAVWPETTVSAGVLRVCIRELRTALHDTTTPPRFIENVHRRGYRFIARLLMEDPAEVVFTAAGAAVPALQPPVPLVGRQAEVAQLDAWFARAQKGQRQVVCITGEPGIGKTALVTAFCHHLSTSHSRVWLASGQCVEHYGAGEAYLPVLEALERLCRAPAGLPLRALLRQYAPTWLAQMPGLLTPADWEALQREQRSTSRERMLREMLTAMEALTVETPLVLLLEDLQWSDYSTLELLSALARRAAPARLLLMGTYRPEDVLGRGHPLATVTQELQTHGQCVEIALPLLCAADVAAYLAVRFPAPLMPPLVAQALSQATDGHPLGMVALLEDWLAHGVLSLRNGRWALQERDPEGTGLLPERLRQMMTRQQARLSAAAQQMLEAASVAGMQFSTAAVAAALATDILAVEATCASLAARQQFLVRVAAGTGMAETAATTYRFRHALYRQAFAERVTGAWQQQVHQRLGAWGERAYGAQAAAHAAQLAVHFTYGREAPKAVYYLQQAAATALQRCAYREALDHLHAALALLAHIPEATTRPAYELELQTTLGAVLMATQGYGSPEAAQAYARARTLCQQRGDTPTLFPILAGLARFHALRAELPTAAALGEECLALAQRLDDTALRLEAHRELASVLFWQGACPTARGHLEQGLRLGAHRAYRKPTGQAVQDPHVACLAFAALVLWTLGYPAQAWQHCEQALDLARTLADPFSLAYAWDRAAIFYHARRQPRQSQACAEAALSIATAQGFAELVATSTLLRGWALAVQGQSAPGIAAVQQGIAALQTTGAVLGQPYTLALLADAYGTTDRAAEGVRLLTTALETAERTGQGVYLPELYRLQGDLLWQDARRAASPVPQVGEAERCFQEALAIARRQEAKSLELRAAMSLVRLWQQQGRRAEAHALLGAVYGWFTEGFDTADLQEAKALLETLEG